MDTAVGKAQLSIDGWGTQDVGGALTDAVCSGGARSSRRFQDDQWDEATPCGGWSVRDLINHVVGEDRWTAPLHSSVRRSTGSATGLDGDLLGVDPRGSRCRRRTPGSRRGHLRPCPAHGTVHLSYGDESMDEYLRQLTADHLVHGWDLAVATGSDRRLDPELRRRGPLGVVRPRERRSYRVRRSDRGSVLPPDRRPAGRPAGPLRSRRETGVPNHTALAGFNLALGRGDLYAIMAHMTQDCVFESTRPQARTGPATRDSRRSGGRGWTSSRQHPRAQRFIQEEFFVAGDRGDPAVAVRVDQRGRDVWPCARRRRRAPGGMGRSARSCPTSRARPPRRATPTPPRCAFFLIFPCRPSRVRGRVRRRATRCLGLRQRAGGGRRAGSTRHQPLRAASNGEMVGRRTPGGVVAEGDARGDGLGGRRLEVLGALHLGDAGDEVRGHALDVGVEVADHGVVVAAGEGSSSVLDGSCWSARKFWLALSSG